MAVGKASFIWFCYHARAVFDELVGLLQTVCSHQLLVNYLSRCIEACKHLLQALLTWDREKVSNRCTDLYNVGNFYFFVLVAFVYLLNCLAVIIYHLCIS